jgi:hypothetical protein
MDGWKEMAVACNILYDSILAGELSLTVAKTM